jgi:DHA1 family bicyclomycin/chloramphenicol resistance-like MFS transporter
MTKARLSNRFIILILGSLMTVSPFSIDMYLPGFSQIAKDLGTTPAKIALSLASYFVGIAIGQLLYGPLLDRYGRKKPLYFGLTLYILACIGCMLSKSVEALIIFRFIQALGGCVAIVATIAMVRDFFPVNESAKILSLLMLILGLSPLLAPTIGGFIITSFGWHWVFIALAIIVFLILGVIFLYLPEGHQPDPTVSLKIKPIVIEYFSILKTPQFYTYSLSGAFSFATLFLYVAGSPFIFMEIFHVSPQMYGGIFALLSVGFIGGNQLNILILRKYKSEQIFRFALLFQVITNIVFLIGALNNWYGLIATIVLFFILLSCLGLTYPNASAVALTPFRRNAGSASAMLGFLQIGIAGFASGCVGIFNSNSSVPIVAIMVGTSLIAFFILMIGSKKIVLKMT